MVKLSWKHRNAVGNAKVDGPFSCNRSQMTDHFIKLDLLMIDIHRLIMTNLGYKLLQVLKAVSKTNYFGLYKDVKY